LIEQHAVGLQAVDQNRQQWPIQVVGDDDGVEATFREWPGMAVLQVGGDDVGLPGQVGHGVRIAIHQRQAVAPLQKPARVTASTTSDVQDGAARANQRREADDPGRRLGEAQVNGGRRHRGVTSAGRG